MNSQPFHRALAALPGLALLAASLVSGSATADDTAPAAELDPAQRFRNAHELLASADESRDANRMEEALILYESALKLYRSLGDRIPQEQSAVARFQTEYCESQAVTLRQTIGRAGLIAPLAISGQDELPMEVRLASAGTAADAAAPNLEALLQSGREALKRGDPDAARTALMNALRLSPDNREARLLAGVAQCRAGRFADAIQVLERLVEDEGTNALSQASLGAAYFGAGRIEDAADAMKDALAVDPQFAEAHFNLAQILLAGHPPDTEQARKHYRKALSLGAAHLAALDAALGAEADVPASPSAREAAAGPDAPATSVDQKAEPGQQQPEGQTAPAP